MGEQGKGERREKGDEGTGGRGMGRKEGKIGSGPDQVREEIDAPGHAVFIL